MRSTDNGYRSRLAPTPSGYLHAGHAMTFLKTATRANERNGKLVLRIDDLDPQRCNQEYIDACIEDLRWLGLHWHEGPDCGGPYGPYQQSVRGTIYRKAFERLKQQGQIYPCSCSRKDIAEAAHAPHVAEDNEPIYPGTCRNLSEDSLLPAQPVAWRFRVPDGMELIFDDELAGRKQFICGHDFGDFVVWRKDDVPAYHLASVADDINMQITEVVRGADLLLSTARQILLFAALGAKQPKFLHCPLVVDEQGRRLSKRDNSLSLRALRERGLSASEAVSFQTFVPATKDNQKVD